MIIHHGSCTVILVLGTGPSRNSLRPPAACCGSGLFPACPAIPENCVIFCSLKRHLFHLQQGSGEAVPWKQIRGWTEPPGRALWPCWGRSLGQGWGLGRNWGYGSQLALGSEGSWLPSPSWWLWTVLFETHCNAWHYIPYETRCNEDIFRFYSAISCACARVGKSLA